MKLKTIKTALQSLLAASAIIVVGTLSAWAGDGTDDLSVGGDSVGTLPSTSGGSAAVSGPSSSDAGAFSARNGANFYLTLPENTLGSAVQSATGSGFVVLTPLGQGFVQVAFYGEVSVVFDEATLISLNAEMGLVSKDSAPVLIGLEVDGIPARPVTVAGGVATPLPVLSLMDVTKVGAQQLIIQSYQSPFVPSQVQITRGAGILVVNQASF